MNTLKVWKIISILVILSMILSIISPVLAEDLLEATSIKVSEEDRVEVENLIEQKNLVKDQNDEEIREEELTSERKDEAEAKAKIKETEVTKIEISGEDVVEVGSTIKLTAVLKDKNGKNIDGQKVIWNSEDEAKAKVDETTGEVTGLEAGKLIIKATLSTKPQVSQMLEISVVEAEKEGIKSTDISKELTVQEENDHNKLELLEKEVTKIEISGENVVEVGSTIKLTAVLKDKNGKNIDGQKVIWNSEDEAKAKVDETTGEVTGLEAGKLIIKATLSTKPQVSQMLEISVVEAEKEGVKSKDISKEITVQEENDHNELESLGKEATKLAVESLTPPDKASGVEEGSEIRIKFNKEVESLEGGNNPYTEISRSEDGNNYEDIYETYNKEYLLQLENDSNGETTIGVFRWENEETITLDKNCYYKVGIPKGIIKSKHSGEELEGIKWEFDTKQQSLTVESLTPPDKASGVKKNTEISAIFNQEVQFKDNDKQVQVKVLYDNDGDGQLDNSCSNYGDKTKHKLVFNQDKPTKVTIQLKDKEGNDIELEENHVYKITISKEFIESKTSNETLKDNITWTFDTIIQALEATSPIDGKTISPDDEIFMEMNKNVNKSYVDGLHIDLYEDDNDTPKVTETGEDLAQLDEEDNKKIIFNLNDKIEVGHSYKIKVSKPESQGIEDLITISFNVEDLGEYGLKMKLDFLRREAVSIGMQDFIAASMNNGVIYAIRDNGAKGQKDEKGIRIYAFDLYGHELWNIRIDDIHTTNASYIPVYGDDGTVYIQTKIDDFNTSRFSTQVFAISPYDGRIKWKQQINEEGISKTSPIIMDDEIIIASRKGLYSYDKNGNKKWKYKINNNELNRSVEDYRIVQPPIKDKNGNIYIAINGKNSTIKDGKIQVLNSDGSEKWSYVTSNGVFPPVIDNNDNAYVIDNTCIIKVLDTTDGTIIDHPLNNYVLSQCQHDYYIHSFNIGIDNTIYAVIKATDKNKENKIIAINQDGDKNYIYEKSKKIIHPLVIDHEGYAYYSERNDGGEALYVLNPYGDKAAEILPVGSTMSEYNSIFIDGDVLIGAKSYSTNVIATKIERSHSKQPASIEIIEKGKKLGVNLEESIAVVVKNTDGKTMIGEELEWESSDESIVKVNSKDGTLICKKNGDAEITVNIKGTNISDKTKVEVIKKPSMPATIRILDENGKNITDELTVEYGIPYQFQVEVFDQYGKPMDDEQVIWFSIIDYFSAIDDTGLLNPKAEGKYSLEIISCTDVRVTEKIGYKIKKGSSVYKDIFPKEAVMAFPGSMALSPVDQYGKAVELEDIQWSSSNEDIAIVNKKGKVTALDFGTTTIEGASKDIAHTRELSVAPVFGYGWNINCNVLYKFIDEGNNGEIYYIDRVNNNCGLISINSHNKTENWRLEVGSIAYYMEVAQDGNIYCLVKDEDGDYKIIAIRPDKSIKWEYKIENYVGSIIHNLEQVSDETIYFATSQKNMSSYLYSIDKDGNEKWHIEFDDKEISSFTLDNEENIICVTKDVEDSVVTKISNNGEIIEEETLENLVFGKGNIEVDNNGVMYGYFKDLRNKMGVCAVKDGDVKWKYYDGYEDYLADNPQIMLNDEGMLYFILTNDKYSYSLYKINNQGKEIWKKKLNNLTNIGRFLVAKGAFAKDNEGNVYLPACEIEITNHHPKYIKSKLFKLNSDGGIERFISYDADKYGQFINIFSSENNDSLYVIGIHGKNEGELVDNLVKFTFENNQEIKIDEIKITADKQSIIVDEFLDLKAEVYNQFGTIMHNEKVTWSSENEDVAIVDNNGHVKGIKTGKANIIATSLTNPQIKKVFPITVVEADAHRVSKNEIREKKQLAINYYKKKGIPQSDWIAFGLSAAGEDINKEPYLSNGRSYIDSLWNSISASNDLQSITEYSRVALGILGGGYDPHNFGKKNIIEKIYKFDGLGQGNNAAVWALIALDASNAKVPQNEEYFTQEYLIDYLLAHKTEYGWSVTDEDVDLDVTGMALYALAPYMNRTDVKESLNETVEWLKTQQNEDGGFDCFGTTKVNTESTAQIIMGLTALGIDPQSKDFTRGFGNPVSAMLNNQLSDGSFEHTKGTGSNKITTEQALQALAALKDFYKNGKSTIFYHLKYSEGISNVTVRIEGENKTMLPQTRVSIALDKSTFYDAVINALNKANINYKGNNKNITSIDGEEGWKWLGLKNKRLEVNSSTDILSGGEDIILVDEAITNPIYTVVNIPTKELNVDKEFPVYVYDIKDKPVAGAEIIYYVDGEKLVHTGIHTDKNGKALITISEEGTFLISCEGKNLVRAKAERINLNKNKLITVNIRVEGPNYTILPKTQVQVKSGDYPIQALKAANLEVTYDKGKTDLDKPKTIDAVQGVPYWDIYPSKCGFDIPLEDGSDIVFTGNGTCYNHANIFIPDDVEIKKEFTVIVKDGSGNPVADEEVIYYINGKYKTPVYTGVYTDRDGKAKLAIDELGIYYITIIPDSDKHLVTPQAQQIEIMETVPIDKDAVTVSVTIEGYRGRKILKNYNVTTGIFDLQPYLRPGTGSTAEPSNDWYADKFDKPTVAHAMIKALEDEDIDYDFQDYGWSLYFAMIDGDEEKEYKETAGWLYEINGRRGPASQDQYIKDGDRIKFWFTVGGWEDPFDIGGDELIDILMDEHATEEEILEALEESINDIDNKADKLETEEDAEKLIEDIEDMAKLTGDVHDRIHSDKGTSEAIKQTINLIKALKKSSEIVKSEEIKEKVDKAAAIIIETIVKLMSKLEEQKEIDNVLEQMIEISSELIEEIGKYNSKELQQKVIKAVEIVISKEAVKEIKEKYINIEEYKASVSISDEIIIESADKIIDKVKSLENKLLENNIQKNKEFEKKITINIPTKRIKEIEIKIPVGVFSSVLESGIDNVELQTSIASFVITPNTFKQEQQNEEISLSAKTVNKKLIPKVIKNKMAKESILIDIDARSGENSISTFKTPIEVSIPYKGKVTNEENVSVYLLKDDGKIESVGGIYDSSTKKVKFITNHFSKYFVKEGDIGFNDLDTVKWAKDEIEAMSAKGIIKGRNDKDFDPNANITRAEFAVLMTRMLKYTATNKGMPFEDIEKDKWYYKEVAAAYENGLIKGVSNKEFNPEGNITGQEAIAVMERILLQRGYKGAEVQEIEGYSQRDKISKWAEKSVAFGLREGLINEDKKEDFIPNAKVTRAQVAAMFYRLYQLIIK